MQRSNTTAVTHSSPDARRDSVPLSDLVTPADLAKEHPGLFTESGLQWLVRHRHQNGLAAAGAVLIISNRAVFVRSRLEQWLGTRTSG